MPMNDKNEGFAMQARTPGRWVVLCVLVLGFGAVGVTGAFHKTLIDTLRGCRDSIDAIREVTDELSNHRRETVEVKASLLPPVLPAPEEPSLAPLLPIEPAQIAAGLSRPRSSRQAAPPEARPLRTDSPPRSQTMIGIAAPSGPRPLPAVVPPPVRPRLSG